MSDHDIYGHLLDIKDGIGKIDARLAKIEALRESDSKILSEMERDLSDHTLSDSINFKMINDSVLKDTTVKGIIVTSAKYLVASIGVIYTIISILEKI